MANEQLAKAIKDWEAAGKHRSDLVRDITTERTLERYLTGEIKKPSPFIARRIARRLKKPYEEVFGA